MDTTKVSRDMDERTKGRKMNVYLHPEVGPSFEFQIEHFFPCGKGCILLEWP